MRRFTTKGRKDRNMSKCRNVQWAAGDGKPVEVDQGALINKILARYPGEFTLFRELLQNSDDAQSESAEIHFETDTQGILSPANSKSPNVVQWMFRNNGKKFTADDWARLVKIAMGNVNPTKIGAFGVGFYSLFSVTDTPIVLSGGASYHLPRWNNINIIEGHAMRFYWMDNREQLCFQKGTDEARSQWTTFHIPLKEPGPMPETIDLMRFLATSITFMSHLKDVKVVLNGHCIGQITKSLEHSEPVSVPTRFLCDSPLKTMTVRKIECQRFTIQARILDGAHESLSAKALDHSDSETCEIPQTPPAGNPSHFYMTKLDLTVYTTKVDFNEDKELSEGLFRCTYKKPPPQLDYSLVYTGKDEYDRSKCMGHGRRIFQGLHADLDGAPHPKIFIGHSTSQSTGIGGHMASMFIPTVERESIDLANKSPATWNKELLCVGGFLARIVYESELSAIETSWEDATKSNDSKLQDQLQDRFIHVLKFFTFYKSIPSETVGQLLQESFYNCSNSPLRLLSSVGVRHATEIRSFDQLASKFLKKVPILLPEIAEAAQRITHGLPTEHRIRDITLSDVLRDLRGRTLHEGEFIACLQWQTSHCSTADMAEISKVASFWDAYGTKIRLASVRSFIPKDLAAHLPSDGPTPASLIPSNISKQLSPAGLKTLGWQEFTIMDWFRYISLPEIRSKHSEHDFTRSAEWAECVLRTISTAWSSSDEIRSLAKSVFAHERCIPIAHKLYYPTETYLNSWDIPASDDLELKVVQLPSRAVLNEDMERLLIGLGVQRHISPQHLLERMVETGKWGNSDLLDFLVQVVDTLTPEKITKLRGSHAFSGVGGKDDTGKTRFRASELYPPTPTFQRLELPVLAWRDKSEWQDTSPEAELMYRLGLRRNPNLEEIIELCSHDTAVGKTAFDYLCANLQSVYSSYRSDNFQHIAFIPAVKMDVRYLGKLGEVFLDNQWKTLGLAVIRHKDQESSFEKLGVRRHPSSSFLLQWLQTKPPPSEDIARQWFEVLSNNISRKRSSSRTSSSKFNIVIGFTQDELETLSRSPIIPKTDSGQRQEMLIPIQCCLGPNTKHDYYTKLFHFVNFGTAAAQFLRACGAKNEPSEQNVADCLVNNHSEFYTLAGHERFLQELRDLAVRSNRISNDTIIEMRTKPLLLGFRRETTNSGGWKNVPSLRRPSNIVIVDDIPTYKLFADSIVAAPQDMPPELVDFYFLLGCKRLTSVIREDCDPSNEKDDDKLRPEITKLVQERLPLFSYSHQRLGTTAILVSDRIEVRVCERLSVIQTLTIGNEGPITRKRDAWAAAKDKRGTVRIWVSLTAKRDMYELAISLCGVLLCEVNLNDALLLTSILSEDLEVLKKRGYEVDQGFLSSTTPNNPSTTDAKKPHCSTVSDTSNLPTAPPVMQFPLAETGVNWISTSTIPAGHSVTESNACPENPLPESSDTPLAFTGFTSYVRNAIRAVTRTSDQPSGDISERLTPFAPVNQVMPREYIESVIKGSIQASVPRAHHKCDLAMVKFLKETYCNTSQPMENLTLLELIEDVGIYVGQGTPNINTFVERKRDRLTCFVRLITRVGKIYSLSVESLRVFYDMSAGCIAFNQQGTIYVNLRYFEVWHYQDVKKGNSRRALSSWFFAVAHEIAHNLVTTHDSEHEFWFAAICELYMDALLQFLGPESASEQCSTSST